MSVAIFPTSTQLPGTDISIERKVMWDTIVQQNVSGKEVRIARRQYPRRTFGLKFNFLRSSTLAGFNPLVNELATLEGFFNSRQGMFDSFLWTDPDDNSITSQSLGTGDSTTTLFQLIRSFGGFIEPVYAPNVNTSTTTIVYKTDWQGKQIQYTTPRTNLVPNSNNINSWSNINNSTLTNAIVGPDGTNDAWTWQRLSSGSAQAGQNVDTPASTLFYTYSIYAKPGSGNFLSVRVQDFVGSTGKADAMFNVAAGTVLFAAADAGAFSNVTGSISTALANGFYRCSMTFGNDNNGSTLTTYFSGFASSGNGQIDQNDTSSNTTINVFGAQFEQSSIPTSYIQTSSIAVTKTDVSIPAWGTTSPGLVTFSSPPSAGAAISADIAYYWPVRFTIDDFDFARFVNLIYENKKVTFETII